MLRRTVFVNPTEPSPLSLRLPARMDARLSLSFVNLRGGPYSTDIGAQLELTGRSGTGPGQSYAVPASDVTAGDAGVIIPAGDLTDPNGYRLNLYGSISGEAALLATGTVVLTPSAGPVAVPPNVIDHIPLTLERGDYVHLDVSTWVDTGKSDEYELYDTSIVASILTGERGTVLVPFTVTPLDANTVHLTLTVEQVGPLPDDCWWIMTATTGGNVTTLCEGPVRVEDTHV